MAWGTYPGPHGRRQGPARLQEEKGRQKLISWLWASGLGERTHFPGLPCSPQHRGGQARPAPPVLRPAPRLPALPGAPSLSYLAGTRPCAPGCGWTVGRGAARAGGTGRAGGPEGGRRRAAPYEAGAQVGRRGESGPAHSCALRAPVRTGAGRRRPPGPPPGKGCGSTGAGPRPRRGAEPGEEPAPAAAGLPAAPGFPPAHPLGPRSPVSGGLARTPRSEPSQGWPGRRIPSSPHPHTVAPNPSGNRALRSLLCLHPVLSASPTLPVQRQR